MTRHIIGVRTSTRTGFVERSSVRFTIVATNTPQSFEWAERRERRSARGGGALRGPRVTTLPFEGPTRHDENNVSMEREMSILAMNAAKYTSMSSLLRKELNQLRAAITERPGN